MQALYGRNGEAPMPVLAASSPADAFETAMEAARIAIEYMTPVILLSDGYIANGAEPWKFPKASSLPHFKAPAPADEHTEYLPYRRNEKLVREWAHPGTPGKEHRIGGLEKEELTGNVSYHPENHEKMVKLRAQKIANVSQSYPALKLQQGPGQGEVLVVGWGSTKGAITVAVRDALMQGLRVSQLHLRHLFPFSDDLAGILKNFDQILVPELNNGQLVKLLRQEYPGKIEAMNKIQGQPFRAQDIKEEISKLTAKVKEA
ncbi:MAG: hypothetical protein U5L96_19545 [Owenweeksia sp.]|nr:hypothetical protein [Owenweeksia sp.]